MSTCRTMYDIGMRYLVRDVTLVNNEHIEQFVELVLRQPHSACWTRKLKLSIPLEDGEAHWERDTLDQLADALALSTNLDRLDIDYAESALCTSPRLADAISRCSRLEALHLHHASGTTNTHT